MKRFTYIPKGVCSRKFEFELDGNVIRHVHIEGGCAGNLLGISRLLEGMEIEHVIERFEGVHCHTKPTSCPDQIAQALKQVNN